QAPRRTEGLALRLAIADGGLEAAVVQADGFGAFGAGAGDPVGGASGDVGVVREPAVTGGPQPVLVGRAFGQPRVDVAARRAGEDGDLAEGSVLGPPLEAQRLRARGGAPGEADLAARNPGRLERSRRCQIRRTPFVVVDGHG